MTTDPASLDRLHDIIVPPAIPWWPPAPGWRWLIAFAAVFCVAMLVRGIIRWQRNRYRREALAELSKLEAAAGTVGAQADALAAMSVLLKRTALTAFSRNRVAALTGAAWFAFLDASGGTRFGNGLGALLEDSVYRSSGTWDANDVDRLAGEIRTWIRRHDAARDTQTHKAAAHGDSTSPAVAADEQAA